MGLPAPHGSPERRRLVTELDALRTTLEAEHAAVYVYGLIGSRTSQAGEPDLYTAVRAAYEAHRDQRDALIGEIAAQGGDPVAAAPAYTAPVGLDTSEGRFAAALALEQACAATYAALVGASTGAQRAAAVMLLNQAAVRELSFRGTPEIFPGTDQYADR
ncbi:MAG TPA: DUF4439 domain-containing protein [Nocardioides bacterium]|nr:DUF4439 domain-containing protein [Nocardioides sp.]